MYLGLGIKAFFVQPTNWCKSMMGKIKKYDKVYQVKDTRKKEKKSLKKRFYSFLYLFSMFWMRVGGGHWVDSVARLLNILLNILWIIKENQISKRSFTVSIQFNVSPDKDNR